MTASQRPIIPYQSPPPVPPQAPFSPFSCAGELPPARSATQTTSPSQNLHFKRTHDHRHGRDCRRQHCHSQWSFHCLSRHFLARSRADLIDHYRHNLHLDILCQSRSVTHLVFVCLSLLQPTMTVSAQPTTLFTCPCSCPCPPS